MIYGYARVSTKGQERYGNSLEAQEHELKAKGAEIVFCEAFTGTTKNRPQLSALINQLQPADKLIITKLDRIARCAKDGIEIVDTILEKGCEIEILNMGTVNNSPIGKVVRTVMLAFAEFERDMIVQRTQEGKAIAKQKDGFKDGRPSKYKPKQKEYAMELLKDHSYRQVEEITGISVSTLHRIRREFIGKNAF